MQNGIEASREDVPARDCTVEGDRAGLHLRNLLKLIADRFDVSFCLPGVQCDNRPACQKPSVQFNLSG
jgi:hypothetical protein